MANLNQREIDQVDDFISHFNAANQALKTLMDLPSHEADIKNHGITLEQKTGLIGLVNQRRVQLLHGATKIAPEAKARSI